MNMQDANAGDLQRALATIGDKWSALILYYLHTDGPSRFTACQLAGRINTKTLTVRLVALERAGLITKQEYNEYPPRTEYAITTKAEALMPVLAALAQWARDNRS
jgi:DNA-binding HxlR family transcriptional regulator